MIRYVVQLETTKGTWVDAFRGVYSDKAKAIRGARAQRKKNQHSTNPKMWPLSVRVVKRTEEVLEVFGTFVS
jgi:hypothetical protein